MPDWSYQTVFRPVLFRLPLRVARDVSLGAMGTLARLPLGPAVIHILGHMQPDARLRRVFPGFEVATPVGLGAGIDINGVALPAFARFGFGFLEVGPVTLSPRSGSGTVARRDDRFSIVFPDPPDNAGLEALAARLAQRSRNSPPVVVRLAVAPGTPAGQAVDDYRRMIERLASSAEVFSLDPSSDPLWTEAERARLLQATLDAAGAECPARAVWLRLPADLDHSEAERRAASALALGVAGVHVDGSVAASPAGCRELGGPAQAPALRLVRHLRQCLGADALVVGSGGIHEPRDALAMLGEGANLVQVDSGLVFAGPGLPKRINEAVLFATLDHSGATEPPPAPELTWFWTLLLAIAMVSGGTLALLIALTRVVLPYDEQFVGLSRAQLLAVNPRLLGFMAHDRVTLAGTMITVGILYGGLTLFGIRRGLAWARSAVLTSAFSGFGTFFLFLGFGYFDPFHAFVTAVLFQFLLLAVHSRLLMSRPVVPPSLRNDRRWRLGLWGQLLMIVQASAFVVAGLVIAGVGVTSVFVPEDLEFMMTTPDVLSASGGPRLLPLIAHDRASFGGMLVAAGLAFLLSALWGDRRGACWLWWTFLLAGVPGYSCAIGIHFVVGYHNLWHLTPAFAGAALFATALALSYPYLCRPDPELERDWKAHLRTRNAPP